MDIILYTIDCPKCKVLEKKLTQGGFAFKICKDSKIMKEKNIEKLPVLQVNGELLKFKEAVDWINKGGR